jgi:hypothetical protein
MGFAMVSPTFQGGFCFFQNWVLKKPTINGGAGGFKMVGLMVLFL